MTFAIVLSMMNNLVHSREWDKIAIYTLEEFISFITMIKNKNKSFEKVVGDCIYKVKKSFLQILLYVFHLYSI